MIRQSAYNAVWRWHFYAGLMVLPFMVLLAVTGGLYLFQAQITNAVYRSWEEVPLVASALSLDEQARRAAAALDARVLQVTPPTRSGEATRFTLRTPDGRSRWAFVNPADGRVIGSTRYGGVMQLIRKIHSLQYFGFWASCLIEITAGWSIVLVGTGIFLWWPRGRSGGVVTVRSRPSRRVFWRDVHAVTGAMAAAVILFLSVTGMPWSEVWGGTVQRWTTELGYGEPRPPAETVPAWQLTKDLPPGSLHHQAGELGLPWAVQRAPVPVSGAAAGRAPAGLDRAVAAFRAAGLREPFTVTLPGGQRGAYVGAGAFDRVEDLRTLYLDQFDLHVLGDVRFHELGAAAAAIQWGIQTHQGQEYGAFNTYFLLAGCVAILMLAGTSVTMWWKRRPRGRLGVPPAPAQRKHARIVLAAMVGVGLLFPLVGASLLAALLVDMTATRLRLA